MRCTRRLFLAFSLLSAAAMACSRDAGRSPEEVLERYYQQQTTLGSDVVGHRPVAQHDSNAVFVTTIEQDDSLAQWYSFLKRNKKGWNVAASRTLKFPESYYALADSIAEGIKTDSLQSIQDANIPLTVSSDSTIKAYLVDHQPVMDSIIGLFVRRAVMSSVDVSHPAAPEIRDGKVLPTNRNERLQDLLEHAKVTRVFRDARYPHCTFVRINGIGRMEAGYIYAEDRCAIPPMDPDNFIYVEKISGNWYVYKVI